jgi:hypothetical protein
MGLGFEIRDPGSGKNLSRIRNTARLCFATFLFNVVGPDSVQIRTPRGSVDPDPAGEKSVGLSKLILGSQQFRLDVFLNKNLG